LVGAFHAEGSSGGSPRESLYNRLKVLALNRTHEYFELVKWYLGFDSNSKFLHENGYKRAKRLYNLTVLIQTAEDKAVEVRALMSAKNEDSLLRLKSFNTL